MQENSYSAQNTGFCMCEWTPKSIEKRRLNHLAEGEDEKECCASYVCRGESGKQQIEENVSGRRMRTKSSSLEQRRWKRSQKRRIMTKRQYCQEDDIGDETLEWGWDEMKRRFSTLWQGHKMMLRSVITKGIREGRTDKCECVNWPSGGLKLTLWKHTKRLTSFLPHHHRSIQFLLSFPLFILPETHQCASCSYY